MNLTRTLHTIQNASEAIAGLAGTLMNFGETVRVSQDAPASEIMLMLDAAGFGLITLLDRLQKDLADANGAAAILKSRIGDVVAATEHAPGDSKN